MTRLRHDRLRCQTCGRAALALFAYTACGVMTRPASSRRFILTTVCQNLTIYRQT